MQCRDLDGEREREREMENEAVRGAERRRRSLAGLESKAIKIR